MRKHLLLGVAFSVAVASALGGCGKDKTTDTSVATLASGSPTVQTSSANAAGGRPQIRLDTSDADRWRMAQVYYHCLKDAGAPMYEATKAKDEPGWQPGDILPDSSTPDHKPDPRFAEPAKKCADKEPLGPPEEDPKRNPHYADGMKAWADCLRNAGMKVTVENLDGGEINLTASPPDGKTSDQAFESRYKQCEMEAFAQ
jgi:hypothetical protein